MKNSTRPNDITVFKSVGLAIEDVATADRVYREALARNGPLRRVLNRSPAELRRHHQAECRYGTLERCADYVRETLVLGAREESCSRVSSA